MGLRWKEFLVFITGIILSTWINFAEAQFNPFPGGNQQQVPVICSKPTTEPTPDPLDCTSYYQCFAWMQIHLNCPTGGYYDAVHMACVEGPCPGSTTKSPSKPKPTRATSKPNKPIQGTTTKTPPGRPSKPGLFRCDSSGSFPHPSDSAKYYICTLIRGRYYYYVFSCPPNLCYLKGKNYCGPCPKI